MATARPLNKILAEFPLPEGKKKPSAKLLKDRAKRSRRIPMICSIAS